MTRSELEQLADLVAERLAPRVARALRTTVTGSQDPVVPQETQWHDHDEETEPLDLTSTDDAGSFDVLSEERQRLRRMRAAAKRKSASPPSTPRSSRTRER